MPEPNETFEEETAHTEWWIWGALAAAVVVAWGVIGYATGVGWFGYRSLLYGRGQLYVMNRGESPAEVSVDGRPAVTVSPDHYKLLELVGGTNRVVVRRGGDRKGHTITTDHSDAFLRTTDSGCLAVVNVTPFYGGDTAPEDLDVVAEIREGERVYVPESLNVFWPGQRFPDALPGTGGPGIWIETVGCALFDEPRYLQTYLAVRARDRLGMDDQRREAPSDSQ